MGEKKQKEASQKKWKKVLYITVAILFVVIMVVSSMGTGWIRGLAPIKAGDSVVIDYTLYNAAGTPLVTTNQQLYKQQSAAGNGILYAKQITLTANESWNKAVYPVQVYYSGNGGSWQEFALYNEEYNALASGVVGMKANGNKKIPFLSNNTMSTLFTQQNLQNANINITSLVVGDSLMMGVSSNPNASVSNDTADSYIRLVQVERKTADGIVVDFGYPYADVTVTSVNKE
jgi:hypothetical protein